VDSNLRFVKAFEPDGDVLLRRVSGHIDDATLEHIAAEDPVGGQERRAGFMNALRDIRGGGILKRQSDFASWDDYSKQDVSELLRFSSYSEPDAVDRKGRRKEWVGTKGHWPRAFACAVLLRSFGDEEIRSSAIGNYNDAMIQMLESLRHLDMGFEPQAISALAWFIVCISDDPGHGERNQLVFAGLGILSLAVNSKNMISYDTIIELTDWLVAEEKRALEEGGDDKYPRHWLFRAACFDSHYRKWIALGVELAAFKATGPCGDAVRCIGQRLSGEKLEP
jgi:hypothetical protein